MKNKYFISPLIALFMAALSITALSITMLSITTLPSLVLAEEDTSEKARLLVEEMVSAVGGLEAFKSKKDVEYTYFYRKRGSGAVSLSTERYIFENEVSWAKYSISDSESSLEPVTSTQYYNGKKTIAFDQTNSKVSDKKTLKRADFLRKTNYYWFAMMFKMLDSGLKYEYAGEKTVGDSNYYKVKVTFEKGIGDVSDIYLLFINKKTKLVDRFLFTVLDFGLTEPLLMEVSYQEIDGLLIPTRRKYVPSNWKSEEAVSDDWVDEVSTNVRFNNKFSLKDLERID